MTIETIEVGSLASGDVLVRIRAASLCNTDLELGRAAFRRRIDLIRGFALCPFWTLKT